MEYTCNDFRSGRVTAWAASIPKNHQIVEFNGANGDFLRERVPAASYQCVTGAIVAHLYLERYIGVTPSFYMVFYKKKCFLKLFFGANHDGHPKMVTRLNRSVRCTSQVKNKWPGRPGRSVYKP